jgi:hypothetical protein
MISRMRFADEGPWKIPLTGFRVSSVIFGPDVDLLVDGPGEIVRVGLSTGAELHQPEAPALALDWRKEGWSKLAVMLVLIGDAVVTAIASNDTGLEVTFESGRHITVPPAESGETWEVIAESYKLYGTPRGVDISE